MAQMPKEITVKVKDEASDRLNIIMEKFNAIELELSEVKGLLADYLRTTLVADEVNHGI